MSTPDDSGRPPFLPPGQQSQQPATATSSADTGAGPRHRMPPPRRPEPEGPRRLKFRDVSRPQVTGWRFMMRRLEDALVRREAATRDDPQRRQSSALVFGILFSVVLLAGAVVLGFLNPQNKVGDSKIVMDAKTAALYVHLKDTLYPVTNLTSARLIIGSPENPTKVSEGAIAKMKRGPLVGIAGAPAAMSASSDRDSTWSVCDQAAVGAAVPLDPETGLPSTDIGSVQTTAIGGPLQTGPDTSTALSGNTARLVEYDGHSWLVYLTGNGTPVRAVVDPTNTVVTEALGLGSSVIATPISKGLFDALPAKPDLVPPTVFGAGSTSTPVSSALGYKVQVGTILKSASVTGADTYYVALDSGVQQVGAVAAAMIRNNNSQGVIAPLAVTPDVLAKITRVNELAVDSYPQTPVKLIDAEQNPVTCWSWERTDGQPTSKVTLLAGRVLPLSSSQLDSQVRLVSAPAAGGQLADQVSMPDGPGRFVQLTSTGDPAVLTKESMWWVGDTGVRYGIDTSDASTGGQSRTLASLNIGTPIPAPWSVVKLFAAGPTLSTRDARIEHDGMNLDPNVAALPSETPGE